MHAIDCENCIRGGYCANLAALGARGLNYTRTSASKPSDSFPGPSCPAAHHAPWVSSTTWLTTAAETTQIAPTILRALWLDPARLDAVRKEGTPVPPVLF